MKYREIIIMFNAVIEKNNTLTKIMPLKLMNRIYKYRNVNSLQKRFYLT